MMEIRIGGKQVGWIRSLQVNEDFGLEPAYVVGSIMPQEHTPQHWSGMLAVDRFYVRKNPNITYGIGANGEAILSMPVATVVVIDKASGERVRMIEGCTLQSQSLTIQANAYSGEHATLQALAIRPG